MFKGDRSRLIPTELLFKACAKAFKGIGSSQGVLGGALSERTDGCREHAAKPFANITPLKVRQDLVLPFRGQVSVQVVG